MDAIRDQIATNGFTFRANDKGPEQAKLNIWNGRVDLAVFGGNGGAPIFKKALSYDGIVILRKRLKDIQSAQPGTRQPIVFQSWDTEAKKFNTDGTLIIGKDDKQVVFLEFQFSNNGNPKCIVFDAKCPTSVSTGIEPMSDSAKSAVRVEAMLMWLDSYIHNAMLLTARKYTPQGGNRSGGGISNRNNNSGGGGGSSEFGGDSADF